MALSRASLPQFGSEGLQGFQEGGHLVVRTAGDLDVGEVETLVVSAVQLAFPAFPVL